MHTLQSCASVYPVGTPLIPSGPHAVSVHSQVPHRIERGRTAYEAVLAPNRASYQGGQPLNLQRTE